MSSRALRKLQREQEQKRQLQQQPEAPPEEEEEDEEEEAASNVLDRKPVNAFNMLTEGGDEDASHNEAEPSDEDEEEAITNNASSPTLLSTPSKPKGKSKKKQKKKKSKAAKAEKGDEPENASKTLKSGEQKDEIDKALESLAIKSQDGSYAISGSKPDESYTQLCRLLEVESKHLNALNEMKRLFGNIMDNEDETPQTARRRGRGPQHLDLGGALAARHSPVSRGQGLAGLSLRRNIFMMGKEEWPKATSGGLGMELVHSDPDGTKGYRFVHNTAYQDVQRQFQSCVESMDPQRMIQMLQFNPYHISTILQVSEIAKQQGDHSVSGDLLERALFSFGRSVHSSFPNALAQGKARLDFKRPENRDFWLAVWRYIGNLGQRGTWRTTYEWAKLLLAMSPGNDPYCVTKVIDQPALRGGQAEHFLKLSSANNEWMGLPNVRISAALAEYKLKMADESRASLSGAVQDFPWIFARLFKELNIEHIPKSIWGKEPRTEREKLDCECYVHGAKDLWNTPEAISFLVEVVDTTKASPDPPKATEPISINEARHVLLSGTPQLISLIPRRYTTMPSTSSDPLPPHDSIESYSAVIPESHRAPPSIFTGPVNFWDSDEDGSEPEEELEPPRRPRLPSPPPDPNTAAIEDAQAPNPDTTSERGWTAFFSRVMAWPNPNTGRPPERQPTAEEQRVTDDEEDERETVDEELPAYNEDTNKRWLAGRGMLQVKDFVAAHGTDEAAWGEEILADSVVDEYAQRVKRLSETNRRFILDYALRQGTSQAVKDLVVRFMER